MSNKNKENKESILTNEYYDKKVADLPWRGHEDSLISSNNETRGYIFRKKPIGLIVEELEIKGKIKHILKINYNNFKFTFDQFFKYICDDEPYKNYKNLKPKYSESIYFNCSVNRRAMYNMIKYHLKDVVHKGLDKNDRYELKQFLLLYPEYETVKRILRCLDEAGWDLLLQVGYNLTENNSEFNCFMYIEETYPNSDKPGYTAIEKEDINIYSWAARVYQYLLIKDENKLYKSLYYQNGVYWKIGKSLGKELRTFLEFSLSKKIELEQFINKFLSIYNKYSLDNLPNGIVTMDSWHIEEQNLYAIRAEAGRKGGLIGGKKGHPNSGVIQGLEKTIPKLHQVLKEIINSIGIDKLMEEEFMAIGLEQFGVNRKNIKTWISKGYMTEVSKNRYKFTCSLDFIVSNEDEKLKREIEKFLEGTKSKTKMYEKSITKEESVLISEIEDKDTEEYYEEDDFPF